MTLTTRGVSAKKSGDIVRRFIEAIPPDGRRPDDYYSEYREHVPSPISPYVFIALVKQAGYKYRRYGSRVVFERILTEPSGRGSHAGPRTGQPLEPATVPALVPAMVPAMVPTMVPAMVPATIPIDTAADEPQGADEQLAETTTTQQPAILPGQSGQSGLDDVPRPYIAHMGQYDTIIPNMNNTCRPEATPIRAIYIISFEDRAANNCYKVGKHTGDRARLLKRYRTALISPVIYGFYPTANADIVERHILTCLAPARVPNDRGSASEWVALPLNHIMAVVSATMAMFSDKQ